MEKAIYGRTDIGLPKNTEFGTNVAALCHEISEATDSLL